MNLNDELPEDTLLTINDESDSYESDSYESNSYESNSSCEIICCFIEFFILFGLVYIIILFFNFLFKIIENISYTRY
jgi:hypothetical protein